MDGINDIILNWLKLLMKLMDIQCDPHIVDALMGTEIRELIECISDFVSDFVHSA